MMPTDRLRWSRAQPVGGGGRCHQGLPGECQAQGNVSYGEAVFPRLREGKKFQIVGLGFKFNFLFEKVSEKASSDL